MEQASVRCRRLHLQGRCNKGADCKYRHVDDPAARAAAAAAAAKARPKAKAKAA